MSAIGMLLQAATIGLNRWQIDSAKDDTKNENDKDQLDDLFVALTAISSVSIGLLFLAMMGGIRFNKHLILPNAIYLPPAVISNIVLNYNVANDVDAYDYGPRNFIGPVIAIFFAEMAYITFYREVSQGIMTKENYPNEQQSCCCV